MTYSVFWNQPSVHGADIHAARLSNLWSCQTEVLHEALQPNSVISLVLAVPFPFHVSLR